MKKYTLLMLFVFGAVTLKAQRTLPNVSLKTTNGKIVNTSELSKEGPVVIALWATWCVPCKNELDAINDVYDEWQDETDITLYAVSIDDSRTVKKVKPLVNGKGWDFNVLIDTNQDFKRALGVSTVPATLIVKNNKIVYRHSGYTPGAEDELYEEIKKHIK